MLAAGPGQKIVVTADGEDESDAVQSISELIESGFGEELA